MAAVIQARSSHFGFDRSITPGITFDSDVEVLIPKLFRFQHISRLHYTSQTYLFMRIPVHSLAQMGFEHGESSFHTHGVPKKYTL